MSVTQKEIAARLEISQSLVARALKGESRVSEATRRRVEEVAQQMGYDVRTNQAARSLSAQRHGHRFRTGVIAVVFPPLEVSSVRQMPFFTPFLKALESSATALDLEVCLLTMRAGNLPRMLRERNVDGVISGGLVPADVFAIRALKLPVITYQVEYQNAHSIMEDNRDGGRQATQHLLDLGHRRIAFLGVDMDAQRQGGDQPDIRRLNGYKDALSSFGLPINEAWIDTDLPLPHATIHRFCTGCGRCAACIGWQTLKRKNNVAPRDKPPFTAVVCHNDNVAMGLIEQAKKDGLRIPDDLSVTGFDDISDEYHFHPAITTIGSSRHDMGLSAMRLLHEVVAQAEKSNEEPPYQHLAFPVSLKVRQTTAALAATKGRAGKKSKAKSETPESSVLQPALQND